MRNIKNFLLISASALAVFSAAPAHASPIEIGPLTQWSTGTNSSGHYYAATNVASTWEEANILAQSLGGYLASVGSAEEQDFLQTTFFSGANEKTAYWIGFTDKNSEGNFYWTSGESVTYTNWGPYEPNNAADGGEQYAAINWQYANDFGDRGVWNDTPNEGTVPFGGHTQPYRAIIEFNGSPNSVPEPGTMTLLAAGLGWVIARQSRRRRSAAE